MMYAKYYIAKFPGSILKLTEKVCLKNRLSLVCLLRSYTKNSLSGSKNFNLRGPCEVVGPRKPRELKWRIHHF